MLPPRLVRRLVLAPLTVAVALALIVLSPLLAAAAALAGLAGRSRPRRMRGLRLVWFSAAWCIPSPWDAPLPWARAPSSFCMLGGSSGR